MDASGSSSRSPVRRTYLNRSKRKGNATKGNAHSDSGSESDSQGEAEITVPASMKPEARPNATKVTKTPKSKSAAASSVKSANTKTPRKVDPRDVPGPSPKRTTRNSDDEGSEKSVPKKAPLSVRSGHTRTSSLSRIKAAASSSSLKVNEAGVSVKPVSKARSVAQSAEDDDEDASLADSLADSVAGASGGRISRTAKDRQEYFKNQSDCHAFGPHRAICSRCKKIVNLTRKQTYAVGPWERHRAKCDQELASDSPLPQNAEEIVNAPVQEIFSDQPIRRNAKERRAFLLDDSFVETAEEDRVKCANCKKWVALKKGHPYDLAKWKQHRDKCPPQSDRVLAAERKLAIVNDPFVKSFDATLVECSKCSAKVVSSSGQDYDLGAWEQHKAQCSSRPQTDVSVSGVNSVPFPAQSSSAKPPSTASTEVTLVAAESAANQAGADQHSTKRPRDESEGAGNSDEDERPRNRPRTENYESQDSPGVLGMLMLPFKAFARGFRESLKSSDRA